MEGYFVTQFFTALLGGAIDPFVLAPAAATGVFISDRRLRAILTVLLGVVLSIAIVYVLNSAAQILPSDAPMLILIGASARSMVAFGVAELTHWTWKRIFRASIRHPPPGAL